jgi:two-component SAPR family response regulator
MVNTYIDLCEKTATLNPKQDTAVFEVFLMNLLEKLPDAKSVQKVHAVYKRLLNLKQLECSYLLNFLFK